MINVTKMKKIAKNDTIIWGTQKQGYSLCAYMTNGHVIYKDTDVDFNPKVTDILKDRFGFIPKPNESFIVGMESEAAREYGGNLLDWEHEFEKAEFLGITYTIDTQFGENEMYVCKTMKGLTFLERNLVDVLKNPRKAKLEVNLNGNILWHKFTFDDETMEYYVLPCFDFGKELEKQFLKSLKGNL